MASAKWRPFCIGLNVLTTAVHNNILYPTDEIKVLGVTFDDSLNFKSHVTDICNRASRQINSFKRFAKYLKIDRRLSVYKSFIQSNFSYCPLVWIFCGRKNSNKLETRSLSAYTARSSFKLFSIATNACMWMLAKQGEHRIKKVIKGIHLMLFA